MNLSRRLSLLAPSLLLAACATSSPDPAALPPGPAPAPTAASDAVVRDTPAVRPGVGVVESASVASLPSASAGGSSATMAYRLKMEDGSAQSVVLRTGERFQHGDRVEVTADGRLLRR
jgi:hypothetical protein